MASQRKKRSLKYKGVPWIESRYSYRYRMCVASSRFHMNIVMSGIAMSGLASVVLAKRLSQTNSTLKALGVAFSIIKTNQALLKAAKEFSPALVCRE